MKIIIRKKGESATAGSVYSTADMAAAEQSEPSDEELAERDKEEAARQEQKAAKDRKEAAKKQAENATKPQQTPAEKGESGGDSDDEEEEEDDSDSEDEESDEDDSDEEEEDDSEDDEEEEDDEESTASSNVFMKDEFRNEPTISPQGAEGFEPADVEKKALQEAALTAQQDDPNAKFEQPKADTVKDVATAANLEFEATAAAYLDSLPYQDVLPSKSL